MSARELDRRGQLAGQLSIDAELAAVARRSDPSTSHDAAASVRVRQSQQQVLALLHVHGDATDDELLVCAQQRGVAISPSGLRSRRSELVRMGYVVDSGTRRLTSSGRRAIVWRAVA